MTSAKFVFEDGAKIRAVRSKNDHRDIADKHTGELDDLGQTVDRNSKKVVYVQELGRERGGMEEAIIHPFRDSFRCHAVVVKRPSARLQIGLGHNTYTKF